MELQMQQVPLCLSEPAPLAGQEVLQLVQALSELAPVVETAAASAAAVAVSVAAHATYGLVGWPAADEQPVVVVPVVVVVVAAAAAAAAPSEQTAAAAAVVEQVVMWEDQTVSWQPELVLMVVAH